MRVEASFLAAMMLIGCAGALGQSGTTSSGSGQTPDVTNNAPVGSKERPALVSAGVMAGLIQHKVDPVYPEDARDVSGSVILITTIDDTGKIAALSVVAGPEKLRAAALDAVKQWTYKPYLLNGNPVYVKTQITIKFSITAGKVPSSARPN